MSSVVPADLPTLAAADDPRAEIRLGSAVAVFFFVGVVGWAAVAPLDAAVYAPGAVVVSGHRQAVQSPDGGLVAKLEVKEGDEVKAGQVLVEFASRTAQEDARGLNNRVITLKAHLSRLHAEQAGLSRVEAPLEFASLNPDERAEADRILALEQSQLTTQRVADRARDSVLRTRITEVGQQVVGYQRELEANRRQQQINSKELAGIKTLAERGYAPETRVNALERTAASLEGEAGAHDAEVGRLRSVAGETELQIVQARTERAQDIVADLRKTSEELQQLQPQQRAASEQLEHTLLRAPVSGAVVGLKANTVGGVAGRGETLMEIVPKNVGMVVEAKVAPKDIDDLAIGQETQLRFPGLHGRNIPLLHGTVQRVAADAIADPRTGVTSYSVDVLVAPGELASVPAEGGRVAALKPGMPVQVLVPLRKRTALQYWLEPLTQSFWHSMRQG